MAYGEDAVKITMQILDQARMQFFELAKKEGGSGYWVRKLLGLRRVSDARNVLSRVMYDSVFNGRKLSLADGTELQFVSDANENTANFYIVRLTLPSNLRIRVQLTADDPYDATTGG